MKPSYKVLHISFADSGGGAELFAYDLARENGFKMVVKHAHTKSSLIIPLGRNVLDRLFDFGSKVVWKLGIKKDLRFWLSITEYLNCTYQKLIKIKAYREADIIHLHNIHGGYFDISAISLIAKEKHIVWTLHDMWVFTGGEAHTFENENYKIGIGKTPYADNYPLRGPLMDLRTHFLKLKKKIYASNSERITFVPVSDWLEKCFKDSFVYQSTLQVKTIRNGIDLTVFRDFAQRTWEKPRVLIFNSSSPTKNSTYFFNLIDQLNVDFELFIIGKEFTKTGCKNVGYLNSKQQLAELYNQVDIFIYPSKAESFGLMVAEAMACGVCVLANETSALTELVTPNTGILVDINNKESFIEQASTIIKKLFHARELGKEASRRISQHFDIKTMYRSYQELYENILSKQNLLS